jgi:hypothetical protein
VGQTARVPSLVQRHRAFFAALASPPPIGCYSACTHVPTANFELHHMTRLWMLLTVHKNAVLRYSFLMCKSFCPYRSIVFMIMTLTVKPRCGTANAMAHPDSAQTRCGGMGNGTLQGRFIRLPNRTVSRDKSVERRDMA